MEQKVITVNAFKGQSYGHKGKEVIIALHYYGNPVLFPIKHPENTKTYGPYHLNCENIKNLRERYPDYIPAKDDPHYKGCVTDWGYDVEEGLCALMLENKLVLEREKNGQIYELTFRWDGERWDAERSRKGKKRKFTKRPKPYLKEHSN
ncbi:hypothetical protein P4679_25805 [Priestia megaterium]|uniref:hypothetical protein n=1 Tax=Priestia megaterium TaxID=1404 RepID=UPI002E2231A5|nr:hypothetical protein [Priestia megaterium]